MSSQKYTEARRAGNKKWDAANLDRVSVVLKKGGLAEVKEHVQTFGYKSANDFIAKAIFEKMENDKEKRASE